MRLVREKENLLLSFNFLEAAVIRRALGEILENYKTPPEELDPKIAAAWYSTRGCKKGRMTPQETRDWLATLHDYKSANLQRVEAWLRDLSTRQKTAYRLRLTLEDAYHLVTVLNDHRLLSAGIFDIGQKEMDARSLTQFARLSKDQQTALHGIHFMGSIIEHLIQHISPDAASWLESTDIDPESLR